MSELDGVKILIVDDEPLIREILEFEMQMLGATTMLAENGKVAFDLIQKNHFDIVISDVMMPEGSGLTLAENIVKMNEHKPIVFFCSGFSDVSMERIKELEICDIFPKPFDREKVIQAIQDAYSKKVS